MSNRLHIIALAGLSMFALSGCRQDMHDQPKYKPQRPSDFFADGRSGRTPVENTVARGTIYEDAAYYTGKVEGKEIDYFPIAVDKALIERGHVKFDIYCSVCHGKVGNGLGMIVRRGFKMPPSYHTDKLRNAPVGHFYDVITNGYGSMWNYSAQIQVRDRWAIASYIRALQLSQNANINDLAPADRTKLASLDKHPPMPKGLPQPLVPDNPANKPDTKPAPAGEAKKTAKQSDSQ